MTRREFPVAVQLAIVHRATDADGLTRCEKCGAWLKSRKDYEIDHIISEGIRPAADKKRKLKPADGQLLCVAVCHKQKTVRDVSDIVQAKRREAGNLGLERPGKAKIRQRAKKERKPLRTALGAPQLARRGFSPAGGMK